MKKASILIFALLYISIGYSQKEKTDEQWYAVPSSKEVVLNLKFAGNIEVQTTTQSQLGLKTIQTYHRDSDLKINKVNVEEDRSVLKITTDIDKDYIKTLGEDQCWNCQDEDCVCFQTDYIVLLPTGVRLNIETISGNIEIPRLENAIRAKSISGFIDVGLKPSASRELAFKSVTGEIYTDFDLKLDENSTPFSKKLNAPLNGGGELLALETISGDIFFRKK